MNHLQAHLLFSARMDLEEAEQSGVGGEIDGDVQVRRSSGRGFEFELRSRHVPPVACLVAASQSYSQPRLLALGCLPSPRTSYIYTLPSIISIAQYVTLVLFIMNEFGEAAENHTRSMDKFMFSHIQPAIAQYKPGNLSNSLATSRKTLRGSPHSRHLHDRCRSTS